MYKREGVGISCAIVATTYAKVIPISIGLSCKLYSFCAKFVFILGYYGNNTKCTIHFRCFEYFEMFIKCGCSFTTNKVLFHIRIV